MSEGRRVAVSGVDTIAAAFAVARDERRAALMPYMMGGFPDLGHRGADRHGLRRGGADLVELGVPYSDPLADGPVIHAAGTRALAAGATVPGGDRPRQRLAAHVPVVVMCYFNPILARGVERFADELAAAGDQRPDRPDLPLEEAPEVLAACDAARARARAARRPDDP